MRETRNAQLSIFDFYSKHEQAKQLKALSDELDRHPAILFLIKQDFDKKGVAHTGACGLSLESIFRCLLLKRPFAMGKAMWKGHDGFKAYVWSSVISYNLVRKIRFSSG